MKRIQQAGFLALAVTLATPLSSCRRAEPEPVKPDEPQAKVELPEPAPAPAPGVTVEDGPLSGLVAPAPAPAPAVTVEPGPLSGVVAPEPIPVPVPAPGLNVESGPLSDLVAPPAPAPAPAPGLTVEPGPLSGAVAPAPAPAPQPAPTITLPEEAVEGSSLNAIFPADEATGDFDVVFTQEKEGLSQAVLKQGGEEVALLSIADLANNPAALAKYARSTDSISGFPMAKSGSKGTSVLVGNQFQVQIRSRADSFGAEQRDAWLRKFDLQKLGTMSKASVQ